LYDIPTVRLRQLRHRDIVIFLLLLTLPAVGTLFSSTPPAGGPRIVSITLAMDQHCRTGKYRQMLKTAVSEISPDFQLRFGLALKVAACKTWRTPGGTRTMDALLAHLTASIPGSETGIVIGLTGKKSVTGKKGKSLYQEGYILVRLAKDPTALRQLLKHEICHLFGATHVNDPRSLMDERIRGTRIKALNSDIIKLHRDRGFNGARFPAPGSRLGELARLYLEIAAFNEKQPLRRAALPEDVYLNLALVYIEMKKYPEAIAQCKKALRINPRQDEAYNLTGIALRRGGQPGKALTQYRKALAINPSHPKIHYNMGIAYMKTGKVDQALKAYRKAVAKNRYFADAWNNLGYIYLKRGDEDQALRHFKSAIAAAPNHPGAHANLAEVLLRKGKLKAALQKAQTAIKLAPRQPGPQNIAGKVHARLGNSGKAENAYKTAITLDPSYAEGYYNLGNLYFRQKKFKEAAPFFEKAIAIKPGFAEAHAAMGDLFYLDGQPVKAKQAYLKSLELHPENGQVHYNLAVVCYLLREFKKALAHMQKAEALGIPVKEDFKKMLNEAVKRPAS
jgi:tetratricopeptide (TPR) repeat protein